MEISIPYERMNEFMNPAQADGLCFGVEEFLGSYKEDSLYIFLWFSCILVQRNKAKKGPELDLKLV